MSLALTWACGSERATAPIDHQPTLAISDGAHNGGNEHFYFLPPMVPRPDYGDEDDFDPSLSPFVTITGPESFELVLTATLVEGEELYQVNWHTNEYDLTVGADYHIAVSVDGYELGSADVTVGANMSQLKNVTTGENVPLVDGRTLPIKFRIEEGAVPYWELLRPSGAGPALISASVLVPEQHAIYAGFLPDYATGYLWRFDLTTDSWTQVSLTNWPNGKYRQLEYDPIAQRILTFWDGLGQVWQLPLGGSTWTTLGNSGNSQDYYESDAYWDPVNNRLNHFAGYGFFSFKNITFGLDASTGAWFTVATSDPKPYPRMGGRVTVGILNGHAVAFAAGGHGGGESGSQSDPAYPKSLDDLWMLDLATSTWENLVPLGGRNLLIESMAFADDRQELFTFGDFALGATSQTNDVWRYTVGAAVPEWHLVEVEGTRPVARGVRYLYYDAPRSRLIVMGGANASGPVSDVWALNLP